MLAESAFPAYQAHLEVWLLVAALAGLAVYVARVIQPKAVAAGHAAITLHQKVWFWSALAVFWVATDYPIHDIAELRLYSVHMVQHFLLTLVVPPMMLMATPTWLARLVIGGGAFKRFVYFWAKPLPAVIVYNLLIAATHASPVVNNSIRYAWLHYGVHTLIVFSSFLVWMCICGPVPELRVAPPMKMVVLFLMSVIPTIPASFLAAAAGVIYQGYNHGPRLWGVDVTDDQQMAGVVMKVLTGFYLWTIIGVVFFRWAFGEKGERQKFRGKLVTADGQVVDDPGAVEAVPAPDPVA
jgi:putative membrane protein